MTGLYGLDGIDNYDRLMLRLSTFEAVEFLSLIPTNGAQKFNNLSQHYLPRRWHLLMNPDALDIAITGQQLEHDESFEEYGRVSGTWPNYRFKSINPESGIRVELSFTAQNTIWWADAPGLFTYFAIFGTYTGTVNGSPVTGHGAFEHGFARKMFDADGVFLPIRLANRIAPSFRPIRYHYELFIGDQAERGGFMHASAFRIPVRDRGGVFRDGVYVPIDGVKITYLMDPPPDLAAAHCPARPPVTFYRSWRVEARTPRGTLTYTARRDWPPASIATNMMYYNFTYSGDFAGEPIAGRGYGEYVHI
jgi:hypothetical protein